MSEESGAMGVKDWHSSKQIRKRARYLLEHPDEETPSDVTFLVGDGRKEPQKTFICHKFILAMVSSMFQAMFYGPSPQTEDTIKIPDVTPTAFQYLLRYAYGEEVDLNDECPDNALDTLYCAKKYLVSKLARTCRDHIQLQMAVLDKEPCSVFQRAPHMDEGDLTTLALAEIGLRTFSVMRGATFLRLSFDCLKQILDCPYLNAEETDIYQSVRRWVQYDGGAVRGTTLRDAFGSLLYSIRFLLFSAAELSDGPVTDEVFSKEEVGNVFRSLFAKVKPTGPFLAVPRTPFPTPLFYGFDLVTSGRGFGFERQRLSLFVRPDLAPQCSAFLHQLIEGKLHIRIASYDNEHAGKTVPLPLALPDERSVLSHSVPGACWFEWDMEGDSACNVRIGVVWKPRVCHSAVFGFVMGFAETSRTHVPFDLWDDQSVQGLADFHLID